MLGVESFLNVEVESLTLRRGSEISPGEESLDSHMKAVQLQLQSSQSSETRLLSGIRF